MEKKRECFAPLMRAVKATGRKLGRGVVKLGQNPLIYIKRSHVFVVSV